MDLKLQAADATSLERVDQALRTGGWQADLTAGSAAGSVYQGRILMRPPGGSPGDRAGGQSSVRHAR